MLITLASINVEMEKMIAEDKRLKQIYESNPAVKILANKIHDSRMLPPPTCSQCIATAMHQLKIKG